jgi:hypothetical protein
MTLDEEIGPEIVLMLADPTPFAHELKGERFAHIWQEATLRSR